MAEEARAVAARMRDAESRRELLHMDLSELAPTGTAGATLPASRFVR